MPNINDKGYVLERSLLPIQDITEIEQDIRKLFALSTKKTGSDHDIKNLFQTDQSTYVAIAKLAHNLPSFRRLAVHPLILNKLHELGLDFPVENMKPVLHFSSPDIANHHFYHRAKPHQDWYGMRGSLDSVVVWLPIVPLTEEMGYLNILPNSHKKLLHHTQEGPSFEITDEVDGVYESVPMNLGDVLIFSTFLIHKSGENKSDHIRLACSMRFDNASDEFFRNRKYPQPFNTVRRPIESHDLELPIWNHSS